jgi:hypothetical protein
MTAPAHAEVTLPQSKGCGALRAENLFQQCNRGSAVVKLNTNSTQVHMLIHIPAREDFDRVGSALQTGNVLWIGSWQSDRIAYFQLPESIR